MTTSGYALNDAIKARARQICNGALPGEGAAIFERPSILFHRLAVPNNGTNQLRFFNASKAKYVTNMDQPGQIPANFFFALMAVRVSFLAGFNVNGTRVSSTLTRTNLNDGGVAATDTIIDRQYKWHEKIRELMSQGELKINIGDRQVFSGFDLRNFPEGKGLPIDVAISSHLDGAAAATGIQHIVSGWSNGLPAIANAFTFDNPYPVMPGSQLEVLVEWLQGVDFTVAGEGPLESETAGNAAGVMNVELVGTMLSAAAA